MYYLVVNASNSFKIMEADYKVKFLEYVADRLRTVIADSKLRQFIACQFALESNFGTSNIAIKQNNICGMKCAKVRPTTRIGHFGGEYAWYVDWNDCIVDYILWLTYKGVNQKQLVLYVFKDWMRKSGYCSEKDYVDRIDLLYNSYY